MDIDLRKTATDAAYIVVGAGVLGFQQAQVRRREARAKLETLRHDTKGTLGSQAGTIKAHADGLVCSIASTATSVGGQVRDQVSGQVGTVSGMASTVDPRGWIEPVVGDLRARVEPVVEQLRGVPASVSIPSVSIPGAVQDLPAQVSGQVTKAFEVGRARVQSVRGTSEAPTD
jgi:hypothetical protein